MLHISCWKEGRRLCPSWLRQSKSRGSAIFLNYFRRKEDEPLIARWLWNLPPRRDTCHFHFTQQTTSTLNFKAGQQLDLMPRSKRTGIWAAPRTTTIQWQRMESTHPIQARLPLGEEGGKEWNQGQVETGFHLYL